MVFFSRGVVYTIFLLLLEFSEAKAYESTRPRGKYYQTAATKSRWDLGMLALVTPLSTGETMINEYAAMEKLRGIMLLPNEQMNKFDPQDAISILRTLALATVMDWELIKKYSHVIGFFFERSKYYAVFSDMQFSHLNDRLPVTNDLARDCSRLAFEFEILRLYEILHVQPDKDILASMHLAFAKLAETLSETEFTDIQKSTFAFNVSRSLLRSDKSIIEAYWKLFAEERRQIMERVSRMEGVIAHWVRRAGQMTKAAKYFLLFQTPHSKIRPEFFSGEGLCAELF